MIQDIAPHCFDNAFASRRAPEMTDFVLLYREDTVLMKEEADIVFPRVMDLRVTEKSIMIQRETPEDTCGYYKRQGQTFIYLFSIDETAFYSVDDWQGELTGFSWKPLGIFRNGAPGYMSFAGITGSQLYRWRQERRFCGGCGTPLVPSRTERAFCCPNCGAISYPRICPAVIVAVTHGERILLSRYAGRDYTRYALIAGFAEFGESIEDTVHREVMEEVGLRVKNLRFYKSQPWSFSDSLLMGFICELDGTEEITLDETELAEAVWMMREEMPDRSGEISLTAEMMERFRLGLDNAD